MNPSTVSQENLPIEIVKQVTSYIADVSVIFVLTCDGLPIKFSLKFDDICRDLIDNEFSYGDEVNRSGEYAIIFATTTNSRKFFKDCYVFVSAGKLIFHHDRTQIECVEFYDAVQCEMDKLNATLLFPCTLTQILYGHMWSSMIGTLSLKELLDQIDTSLCTCLQQDIESHDCKLKQALLTITPKMATVLGVCVADGIVDGITDDCQFCVLIKDKVIVDNSPDVSDDAVDDDYNNDEEYESGQSDVDEEYDYSDYSD